MSKDYSRTDRVGDFLKQELAQLIQQEVRDPRVGMISITGVEVSRDLSYARVFVTVVGKENAAEAADSVAALNRAAGFLRSQLARNMRARTTPRLVFEYDTSIGRGAYLSELIEKARESDRSLHGEDENEERGDER